ncbi:putative universal stress family protein [Elsinoe australis]|uniref:Putative universal stress family protein n=1 Tax=Elsinoe australis TaxID=40998 RepID=A0A4U7B985_9PEZI|nr:putative universal stress family protein [Elsinoe australis]
MENNEPSPKTLPVEKAPQATNGDANLPTSDIPQTELPPTDNGTTNETRKESDTPAEFRPLFGRLQSSDGIAARRPSVQFVPQVKVDGSDRSRSRRPTREAGVRRLSSPPPPNQFQPRVSFDTFDNRDASDFSLTLSRKHKDYVYNKRSRTFLCGTDTNEYSDTALEWLIDELVDDGDEIVCLRVVEKDSKEAIKWAGGGSNKEGRERSYRAEAQRMLEKIQEKNSEDRAINLVLEFTIGKVHETIQHMIAIYEPAILVVGTRGKSLSGFQGLMPGSVSKYCLQHSPVPVVVVRPSSKRDKKKRKRLKDPARRGYRDILDKSEDAAEGGHLLDSRNRYSIIGTDVLSELSKRDEEEEARMVAEAIGYRPGQTVPTGDGPPLSRVISGRSEVSNRSARSGSLGSAGSDVGEDLRSPVGKLMKSPELRDLDTPPGSDDDDSSDEGYEAVPAYVLAQEEALSKARERAIKAEEEEREAELERIRKEEERVKKENMRNAKKGLKKKKSEDDYQGAAGVLNLLDDLKAQEKQKGRK